MPACMTEEYPKAEPVAKAPPGPPHADLVTSYVNDLIGRVPGHLLTKTIPLWPRRWRVNVYVRDGGTGLVENNRVSHSFFVVTDVKGGILRCVADHKSPSAT
ncbi:MAG: hypothetical protein WCI73_07370 [Phycisphaerae bacterium]